MRSWTFLANGVVRYASGRYVLLLVTLVLAAACLAQQEQAARRRRTPRGARFKTIQLPEPVKSSAASFEKALVEQQVVELPSNQRLKFTEIGQLAWAAQGVTVPQATQDTAVLQTPAGAAASEQVPIRVYFSLPDGLHLYNASDHALQQTGDRDLRAEMATALLNLQGAPTGGCQIILVGSSRDFVPRYGTRARTVMLLRAGQMAQSIQLQAVTLGLTFVSIESVDTAAVKRTCRFPRSLEPLYVVFVGYPASQIPQPAGVQPVMEPGKRVVIVASQQGFRDEELFQTKRALELASVQVLVAGTRLGAMMGELGGTINADLLLNQVNLSNFDGVIFVGGRGAVDYYASPAALNLARQAVPQRKVVAAIGAAPAILANAGVLRGVRSTSFLSEQTRLVQAGAFYTGNPVEKDGLIVTATGPLAAPTFARAILDALAEAR